MMLNGANIAFVELKACVYLCWEYDYVCARGCEQLSLPSALAFENNLPRTSHVAQDKKHKATTKDLNIAIAL